jgi:hypothetical protein
MEYKPVQAHPSHLWFLKPDNGSKPIVNRLPSSHD